MTPLGGLLERVQRRHVLEIHPFERDDVAVYLRRRLGDKAGEARLARLSGRATPPARYRQPRSRRGLEGVERGLSPELDAHGRGADGEGDLVKVCMHYFGKPRQRGTSHHVYKMPWPGDPRVNIQNAKGKAKSYQVRQVLKVIAKLEEMAEAKQPK